MKRVISGVFFWLIAYVGLTAQQSFCLACDDTYCSVRHAHKGHAEMIIMSLSND